MVIHPNEVLQSPYCFSYSFVSSAMKFRPIAGVARKICQQLCLGCSHKACGAQALFVAWLTWYGRRKLRGRCGEDVCF